jgi:hypothetical protein
MRYSYGVMDRRRILTYRPQLFQRTDDLLVFPSKDFAQWHSEVNEFLDGIYQINAKNREKEKYVDISDFNLAAGLMVNINFEMDGLFDPDKEVDFTYHYVSVMDEEYKRRRSKLYGRYMYKIDREVVQITPQIRYRHMMEIVDYAHKLWADEDRITHLKMIKKRK